MPDRHLDWRADRNEALAGPARWTSSAVVAPVAVARVMPVVIIIKELSTKYF
jgi:hypothetical protein